MKIRQLVRWIEDNNVDENITEYLSTHGKTRKTINWIEKYIGGRFGELSLLSDIIGQRMLDYKRHITPENGAHLVEDTKQMLKISSEMDDLNMIATYIEKHKPE